MNFISDVYIFHMAYVYISLSHGICLNTTCVYMQCNIIVLRECFSTGIYVYLNTFKQTYFLYCLCPRSHRCFNNTHVPACRLVTFGKYPGVQWQTRSRLQWKYRTSGPSPTYGTSRREMEAIYLHMIQLTFKKKLVGCYICWGGRKMMQTHRK